MVAIIRECMIRASVDVRSRPRASPYAFTSSTSGRLSIRVLRHACILVSSHGLRAFDAVDYSRPASHGERERADPTVGRPGRRADGARPAGILPLLSRALARR